MMQVWNYCCDSMAVVTKPLQRHPRCHCAAALRSTNRAAHVGCPPGTRRVIRQAWNLLQRVHRSYEPGHQRCLAAEALVTPPNPSSRAVTICNQREEGCICFLIEPAMSGHVPAVYQTHVQYPAKSPRSPYQRATHALSRQFHSTQFRPRHDSGHIYP